jgi:hypothetical protein
LPEDVPIIENAARPYDTLRKWKGLDPLTDFLVHTRSAGLTKYQITVDPMILCEELWNCLKSAVNGILSYCNPRILERIRLETNQSASS